MTPIALVLNVLLGLLLVAALGLGVRLDRRLKALRDSQASFIKAVHDLDQASVRTHAGLAQWREATDEARELLHDRIEKAKLQGARLEALLVRASATPDAMVAPARAEPAAGLIRDALREAAQEVGSPPARSAPISPAPISPAPIRPVPVRPAASPALARSRVIIDDDLFEAAPAGAVQLQRDLASALERRS